MTRLLTIFTLGLIFAVQTFAHDLYLKADSYFAAPNSSVKFEVINGEFKESVAPFTTARFSDSRAIFPLGKIIKLTVEEIIKGEKSSFINLTVQNSGTYVFGISTTARELTFTAKAFNEALKAENIPDALAEREKSGELEKDGKGMYSRHAKVVFQVGDERSDVYKTVLGYPVEIVPQKNPYELKSGKTLEILCLRDGKPISNQRVSAGRLDANGKLILEPDFCTNGKGIAKIKLNGTGKWFMRFAGFVRITGKSYDHESAWATLSFEIR